MMKCLSCDGIYEPIGRDGIRYFHACPPVLYVSVVRNGQAGIVPLRELAAADVVKVIRNGKTVDAAVAALLEGDIRVGDVALPHPNARDENVEIVRNAKGERVSQIKAAGAGVVDVVIVAPLPPPVLPAP